VSVKDTQVWIILKDQFDHLLETSPGLADALAGLAIRRGAALDRDAAVDSRKSKAWVRAATVDLETRLSGPTEVEVREATTTHSGRR